MTAVAPTDKPRDVDLVRNLLIPLRDGTTLCADLHLPSGPGRHPTLISLYPYRKDDVIGSFSIYARRWFAQRGYAHLLVDVRGYGGSEGHHAESFDPAAESADAAEVVEWAARQDWSTGAVAVWGVSYGGLMALAAGTARPPALKAIAPIYPLWNIYDDVVAPGDCRTMITQHQWSTIMLAQRLAPPSFRDQSGRWLRVWRARLDEVERDGVDISQWREHNAQDEYWARRVLPLGRIEVPTFLIGGWRDLFASGVAAAYERISAPKRLLVGPWLHVQPDRAEREPVDWLVLLLAFFDDHVRAEPADEARAESACRPPVLAFVQGDGGWRAAECWPPSEIDWQVLTPGVNRTLGTDEAGDGADEYQATPLVGGAAGQWDAMGTGMGYPLDQEADARLSLTYMGAPVHGRLELIGSPQAVLDVERLDGQEPFPLVAKLIDVAPDGRAELITRGQVRATSRPTTITFRPTAWGVATGHRIALSVACADFPQIWPEPDNPRIRVHHHGSEVRLPIAAGAWGESAHPPRPADVPDGERFPWTLGGAPRWSIDHDLAGRGLAVTLGGSERLKLAQGGTFALRQRATARVTDLSPDGACVRAEAVIEIETADGERVEVQAESRTWRNRDIHWGRVSVDGCPLIERSWRSP